MIMFLSDLVLCIKERCRLSCSLFPQESLVVLLVFLCLVLDSKRGSQNMTDYHTTILFSNYMLTCHCLRSLIFINHLPCSFFLFYKEFRYNFTQYHLEYITNMLSLSFFKTSLKNKIKNFAWSFFDKFHNIVALICFLLHILNSSLVDA